MSDVHNPKEHDFEKLLKKTKTPSPKQVKKAEKGERGEGIRDALKAGHGDITKGVKSLHLKKPGLPAALKMVKKGGM